MNSERQQINSNAGIHHTLSRQILGIDWYDTESSARRVIEWLAEGQEPVGYVVEKRTGSLTALSGVIRASAILEDFVTDGTPLYAAPVYEVKAQGVVMHATDGGRNPRYEGLFDGETEAHRATRLNAAPVQQVSVPQCVLDWFEAKQAHVTAVDAYNARLAFVREHMPFGTSVDPEYQIMEEADRKVRNLVWPMFSGLRDLNAAPAAPAADAGIVDMYRHLQKVTPYRFKKIQDASITDGGDVMYFHKDRFDAALLADMAAHSAKGVV